MSKNDRQKYADSKAKTKAVAKVGLKAKMAREAAAIR